MGVHIKRKYHEPLRWILLPLKSSEGKASCLSLWQQCFYNGIYKGKKSNGPFLFLIQGCRNIKEAENPY